MTSLHAFVGRGLVGHCLQWLEQTLLVTGERAEPHHSRV